jgi:hypothetical protein
MASAAARTPAFSGVSCGGSERNLVMGSVNALQFSFHVNSNLPFESSTNATAIDGWAGSNIIGLIKKLGSYTECVKSEPQIILDNQMNKDN